MLKNKLYIFWFFALILGTSVHAQIIIISTTKPGPNSAETEAHYRFSEEMTQKTRVALEANELTKAKYYLDQWSERSAGVNVNFYVLQAQYCTKIKDYGCAKRCYKKAYKKFACFECKEMMEQLP